MASIADSPSKSDHLASILKALGNPARLRIIASLVEAPENVGALAARLGLQPAIVSQELKILRMTGLVSCERSGGFATYSLAEPQLRNLVACLEKCRRG